MALRLITTALAAIVVGIAQPAFADVTYSYTGAKFDNVKVLTIFDPEVPPENALAESARVKAILLNDQINITLTTPVYIPAGWTTFDYTGVYGELGVALWSLQPSNPGAGVGWTLTNSAFGGSGHIQVENIFNYDPWMDSRLSVSLHVGAGNTIDAWEITMLPGDAYGPPTWDIKMGSSSTTGDTLLYEFGAAHGYQRQEAATSTIGNWTVAGPVTEPGPATLMLGGLAALGLILKKRRA
ncbi:hypothetical protein GJ697_13070 [Pseudoduganella sp. FT25W]|uniref:PEP-CTERM sorting domain-containing protein n=1 Tax=Duganella alba TaxID=2666081 RepID=A0A6L5QGL2_9BURK|nr:hypothetical protein [Duganella alba]MRX08770.1 hypothetical protein [Duganella alba]MRX18742.1 hypothetical protein [Duganella alba]